MNRRFRDLDLRRRFGTAILLGSLALAATAACTDEGSPDDSASQSAEMDGFDEALAYSECMRENGIEEFPDPEQNGDGGVGLSLPEGIDPEDEEFKAAEAACEDLMPGPGDGETIPADVYEGLVEYSECMRENGVPGFPDPEPNGGIRLDGDELGVEMDSEEFRAAEEACDDLRPDGGEQGNSEEEG